MGTRIRTNSEAFNALRNLANTAVQYSKSVEKLSSGLRINRAGDDAAGLSISEKLRSQTRGLAQAQRNAQDGISLIQTGEGALNETHSILQRMRELGVQAANGTLSDNDRRAITAELTQLRDEIDNISIVTDFNGTKLLSGGSALPVPAHYTQATPSNPAGDTTTVGGSFTGNASTNYVVKVTGTTSGSHDAAAIPTRAGAEAVSVGGTYTGSTDANYLVKVTSVTTVVSNLGTSGAHHTTASLGSMYGAIPPSVGAELITVTVAHVDASGHADQVTVDTGSGPSGPIAITTSGQWAGLFDLGNGMHMALGNDGSPSAIGDVVTFRAANHPNTIQYSTNNGSTWDAAGDVSLVGWTATLDNGLTLTDSLDQTRGVALNDTYTFAARAPRASAIQYSTDGGQTYNGTDLAVAGTTPVSLNNGLTFAFGNTASSHVGDTFSFSASPAGTSQPARTITFQIGANDTASDQLKVSINGSGSAYIGHTAASASLGDAVDTAAASLAAADFQKLIDSIDSAINDVSQIRGYLGANQNHLEHAIANLGVSQENTMSAESRIRDVDMASEMVGFTRTSILQQAGQAILAQANQAPQGILSLLRG